MPMNRQNDIWLNSWQSNRNRPIYSRAYSKRFGYRIFLGLVTTIIICLLIIVGLYKHKIQNRQNLTRNNNYAASQTAPYITANNSVNNSSQTKPTLGIFNRNNIFETDPKTNKPLLGIKAKSYYVANGTAPAFEYNSTKILPIASITKLITAAVASELMEPDETITITKSVLATEGRQGGFAAGDKLTVSEILHPLLMVSSNDAAEAIALKYGRSDFITAMNAWVWKIGAYSTNFEDPSGLTPQNVSTARDLVTIVRYIDSNHPELLEITRIKNYRLRKYSWTNPTNFLNMSSYLGGKNGFTNEAEQTSIAIFSTGALKKVLAVVLDSPTRDRDILTLLRYVE